MAETVEDDSKVDDIIKSAERLVNKDQMERRILLEVAELREFTFLAKNKGLRCILFPFEDGNTQDLHFTFK